MSFVKILEDVAVMISINTHLKGVLYFRDVFDLDFLFIVYIWHDVNNVSGYTVSSIYFQTFSVSLASSDFVDLFPNIWCNNSKENFFLEICFYDFDFSFILTKKSCFRCALCSDVTTLCLLSLKNTAQNPWWERQVCNKFINMVMENIQSHKSIANITLYNVAMKGFTLS